MKSIKTGIKIKINSTPFEEIYTIHSLCNRDFTPNLSERVNIREYSKKLSEFADIIGLYYQQNLVGLIAIYCNDIELKHAYISSVCILREYRGLKLGELILNEAIVHARNKGMMRINLEVAKNAITATHIYKNAGFQITSENSNIYYMSYYFINE